MFLPFEKFCHSNEISTTTSAPDPPEDWSTPLPSTKQSTRPSQSNRNDGTGRPVVVSPNTTAPVTTPNVPPVPVAPLTRAP